MSRKKKHKKEQALLEKQHTQEHQSRILLEQKINSTKFRSANQKNLYQSVLGYDISIASGPAGCVLPGTDVEIFTEDNWQKGDYFIEKFGFSKKDLFRLRKHGLIECKKRQLYNESSLTTVSFKYLKLNGSGTVVFAKDSNYKSKYLKLKYWLGFLDAAEAVCKVKKLRKKPNKKFFERDYDFLVKNNHYNPKNIDQTVSKIIFKLLSPNWSGWSNKELSNWCLDFWLIRGWSVEESIEKITNNQRNQSLKFSQKRKQNPENYNDILTNQIGYWLKKGFSEEEAKEKVRERQQTFSLKKCIEKYGETEGQKRFDERQEKWRSVLDENWEDIKRKIKDNAHIGIYCEKYFNKFPDRKNDKANFYFVKFFDDDFSFYKVGITTRSVKERLSGYNKILNHEIIFEEEFTLFECFKKERYFLEKYKDKNVTIKYKDFNSIECFNENVWEEDLKCNSK